MASPILPALPVRSPVDVEPGARPASRLTPDAVRGAIAQAHGQAALAAAAATIRAYAIDALAAGCDVLATTRTISELNDEVTRQVVEQTAAAMAIDLHEACWLTFGSQGRGEQTIATDQDNGLVFASGEHERWRAFGAQVNDTLAACGYPLCSGRVMAGQPLCCLTADEWCRRFDHWMAHGSGNDLLAARIYFDLRPLVGRLELAAPLTERLRSRAASTPRFIKQMADVVLCNHVPLNWLGRVMTERRDGRAMFDLKQGGTALYVDAARLWALAHSIADTATDRRLQAAATAMHVPSHEALSWQRGFEALQLLRLQVQRGRDDSADPETRNWVAWDDLGATQRGALRSALRTAGLLQQRITLDYRR